MARAASRCSSVLSRVSLASSRFVAIRSILPLRNNSAVTIQRLSTPCSWYTREVGVYGSHGFRAIIPVNESPSRNVTTSQDALLDRIKQAKDIEELFLLLSTNKARLTENHIAQAFFVLVALRHGTENQDEFSQTFTSRQEFITLCDLAENRVSTFDDVLLVDILYCSFKLLKSPSHPLIRELRNQSLRRLDSFETTQLSKMAVCLADMGEKRAPSMGRLVNAFSCSLDKTKHFRELSTLMKESNALMSGELKTRVLGRLKILLDSENLDINKATCGDYRKVFMCIDRFTGNHENILHRCASRMEDDLDTMSTREVCVLLSCNIHLRYKNQAFSERLRSLLYERLTAITDPTDMARSTEILGFRAPAHVKFQLEENAMRLVDEMPIVSLGNLCTGLRRMGYLSHTPLHDKISKALWQHSADLTLDVLLPVVEYYKNLVWMTEELWQLLGSRAYELTMAQIAQFSFLSGVYILSLIPTFHPNRELLDRVLRMLPQLHAAGTNILFKAMKRMVKRSPEDETLPFTKEVLATIQRRAVMSLHRNTSANYLLGLLNSILEEEYDLKLVDAIYKQLTKITSKIGLRHAVECARSLYQTRYYSEELLDRILEVTLPNIDKVTPFQVLYLIGPYCSLNYQPGHSEVFFEACAHRVIPFLDELPCGFLVDLAHLMSFNQQFPEAILRHIFSLEVLTKLDEELEEIPDRCDMYRKKLMFLNRTVALECPELQVPWFHEEYCQGILKNRKLFYHPGIQDIQKHLVEVLGGAQYLRSFVTTPYYFDITFECILDASGAPLACANYGSALSGKNSLSGSVLSDLMQWDTERRQLPDGAQRVAIDYMFSSAYCVNSGHMLGMSATKKRQLELLGYQYIQIPFFEWSSLALTGREEKEEYLRMKLFSSDTKLTDIASAPPSFQDYSTGSIFAPFIRPKRQRVVTSENNLAVRALHSYDRIT